MDILLDPNSDENIILYNENDEPVEFEQIAIIVYKKKGYALLHPVESEKHGISEDEALVFQLHRNEGGDPYLTLEEDEKIIEAVFKQYDKLYKEENN